MTGELDEVVLPFPSLPEEPVPQQYARLSEAMTQVAPPPTRKYLIVFPDNTPLVTTDTGAKAFVDDWPLPSRNDVARPQQ